VLQVARAVLERALLALQLAEPHAERLFLRKQPLLDARDLRPAGAQLVVVGGGGRAGGDGDRRLRRARRGRGGLGKSRIGGGVAAGVGRRRMTGSRGGRATPVCGDYHDSGDRCGYDRCKHDFH
jgi:hypothetical protein